MTCPRCRGMMQTYQRVGVTIDQCTNCRGIFLDHGELEQILNAERTWGQQPYPQQPPPPAYGAPAPAPGYGAPVPAPHAQGGHGHGYYGHGKHGGHGGYYGHRRGGHGYYGHGRHGHGHRRSFIQQLFD
ncbi:zf-TFIIB domain-containing protein [Yinghuangia sp. ASG 101]|nr:zf-TFIIB domain-containing protein [Yinghuangia sp. ASG 101]UGQ15464.1 zf-TFIIB domain-containing protein [Yinghuangia sp. ASG 101]